MRSGRSRRRRSDGDYAHRAQSTEAAGGCPGGRWSWSAAIGGRISVLERTDGGPGPDLTDSKWSALDGKRERVWSKGRDVAPNWWLSGDCWWKTSLVLENVIEKMSSWQDPSVEQVVDGNLNAGSGRQPALAKRVPTTGRSSKSRTRRIPPPKTAKTTVVSPAHWSGYEHWKALDGASPGHPPPRGLLVRKRTQELREILVVRGRKNPPTNGSVAELDAGVRALEGGIDHESGHRGGSWPASSPWRCPSCANCQRSIDARRGYCTKATSWIPGTPWNREFRRIPSRPKGERADRLGLARWLVPTTIR